MNPFATLIAVLSVLTLVLARPHIAFAADAPSDASGSAPPSKAPDEGIPIELTADEVKFDREKGIVTASGNIVITSEDRTIFADSVSYDQNTDVVSARGNITLVEPTGEVLFGERMELTGDLKNGFVENLSILLKDRARLAANDAKRTDATLLEMNKAVYSPCKLCEKDPNKPPLWQLKAVKIVHDKTTKEIKYYDAWLEFAGVPVLYTPYLSHGDSTVKRHSGFLAPGFGGSSDLGPVISVPYFYALDDHKDLTVAPMVSYDEGPALWAEYRQRMAYGEVEARGSIAYDSDNDTRGHIAAKGRFNINDTWRWGFDANRAIGETYMRRYGFSADNTLPNKSNSLTSHLFTEGFRGRNYMSVNAYAFQGLRRSDRNGAIPIILPMLDYNYEGKPDKIGGRTSLDVNLQALTRTSGMDSRRFSLKGGWQVPFTGPLGDLYKLSASVRGDLYHVNGLAVPNATNKFNGVTSRVLPEVRLDWRYPFIRDEGDSHQIVEPIVSAIYSPYGGNSNKIPNEDSLDFEFDDTNLFSSSRFAGTDRVEGGPRINYGLKWGLYGKGGGSSSFIIGQSYRLKTDDSLPIDAGLDDHFSDIVAKFDVSPGKYLNLLYRTRINKDNYKLRRSELSVSTGIPALRLNLNYIKFVHEGGDEYSGREQISYSLSSQFNRNWKTSVQGLTDLVDHGNLRSLGLNLTYEDECFIFSTDLYRSFYQDREIKPFNSIMFKINLKTLGGFGSGISTDR